MFARVLYAMILDIKYIILLLVCITLYLILYLSPFHILFVVLLLININEIIA